MSNLQQGMASQRFHKDNRVHVPALRNRAQKKEGGEESMQTTCNNCRHGDVCARKDELSAVTKYAAEIRADVEVKCPMFDALYCRPLELPAFMKKKPLRAGAR